MPIRARRRGSCRLRVGTLVLLAGLHTAFQTSATARGLPTPPTQPTTAPPAAASTQSPPVSPSLPNGDQPAGPGAGRSGAGSPYPSPEPGVLTTLEAALGLSLEEAQRGHPVKVAVTVTYCHPQWRMLFVQGAALGTFLKIPPDTGPLRPGDVVEISGSTTSANGYAELKVGSLKPTGQRRTLLPQPWSIQDILVGRASGQWVQIEGTVLAAFAREGRLLIQTAVGSTNVTAYLLSWQPEPARQLLDARVRITGVVSVQFDGQGHRLGAAVLAQEPEQVQVLQAAATNPRDVPLTPIARLTVAGEGKAASRVRVQGTLEELPGGPATALRDRTGVIQVRPLYRLDLPSETTVDVIGYPYLINGELCLKDAVAFPADSATMSGTHLAPESAPADLSLPMLGSVQAVRQLKRSEAARGYPVRLEAVVTFSDPLWWSLFVQDASGGVFITPSRSDLEVRPGQRVRVEGVTAAGDFAPIVARAAVEILGEAPMPAPVRASLDGLLAGQLDSQWVEVRGVVQSALEKDRRCWLRLMTAQGQLEVLLGPAWSLGQAEELVDARVTVRGVAGGEFNRQGQIVAARIHVPNASAIQVDEAPPANPFATPVQLMADLSRYQPDRDASRRVKISGWVTCVAGDQTITLQDEGGGMLVRLARYDRLPRLGDRVEILGFPTAGEFSTTLKDAWSRIVGRGPAPAALMATPEQILTNEWNARLVRINARLVQDASVRPAQILVLSAGSIIFEALLPADLKVETEEQLATDSRVEVTGVCLLERGRWGQVRSFRLRLRESGDLKILTRPPWWNLRRLLWTLAGTGVLGTLVLGWDLLLAKKNRLLREQVRERQRAEAQLQQAHVALQQANENLERRVAERTVELREQITARDQAHAELAAAQKDLMEASRQAGMAEVATGVLHNVGNVLNSINVSTTIIRDKLRQSEFVSLGKLRDLLRQHESDLPAFLTTDPRGKIVPGFIIKLADNLDQELSLLQAEHEHLAGNVEHIKEIVAVQQTYARISGARERLAIASLVDDALRMNTTGFARYGIQVVRRYGDVPPVTVDKHKVLQILVNLINNAKHALDASGRADRQLTLEIGCNGNQCFRIAVSDNGIGIPPENLARVFSHGFTTRKDGHGFGLHSGASAAKEMGGQLKAHSGGAGQGATFTLELPLDPQKAG